MLDQNPVLPRARGPVSQAVLEVFAGERAARDLPTPEGLDPYGDDLHLALYLCYELHYHSFPGVDAELEWDPDLLRLRRELEQPFLAALQADVAGGDDVDAEIDALLVEATDGDSPSWRLARDGELWQLREYVAHRSIYHLKEADPQAWVIPRLDGQAKASLVTVEHDEFGAGRADRVHAKIFADMMDELGLDSRYHAFLDEAPGITLATVNVMSLFGLHRRWRGASVGQFALVEVTSSPGSARLVKAMRRLGTSEAATAFYAEHVEADAVHEQLVRRGLLADLTTREPELAADIVFGIQASTLLEDRMADYLVAAWDSGSSSLRRVPEPV
ncbi:iron-containing redox enzyme family protein [Actinomycetospora atypica]|uniref:Iron-containing redox enzyme family protein n=1 Tax=Actinomycetospora atypica TaxID=1290095 RepID=A0ABV9YGP2_9PSEU